MTNKAAIGLMGAGSLSAGLGAGYKVGVNVQPYDYKSFMNVFYANLIEDAKSDIAAYYAMNNEDRRQYIEFRYKEKICQIANDTKIVYESDDAKNRVKKDKELCEKYPFEQDKWVEHLNNYPKYLKDEWDDFIKHVYEKPSNSR